MIITSGLLYFWISSLDGVLGFVYDLHTNYRKLNTAVQRNIDVPYGVVPILTGRPLVFVPYTNLCLVQSTHAMGKSIMMFVKEGRLVLVTNVQALFLMCHFFGQENEGAYLCRECKRYN